MRAKTSTRRKANTAMVFNPSRSLSVGGRSTVRRAASRKNPSRKTTALTNPRRKRHAAHHTRRRRNPATGGGLFVAAFMAAVGVSLFDIIANKTIPQSSPLVRVGVKLGGAWLFQSSVGSKIPFLGKHKNDIALVLAVAGGVDLLKLYVLPIVSQAVGNLTGGNVVLFPAPAAAQGDGTTAGIYGNAPAYRQYA
jgi:hypothetical protein